MDGGGSGGGRRATPSLRGQGNISIFFFLSFFFSSFVSSFSRFVSIFRFRSCSLFCIASFLSPLPRVRSAESYREEQRRKRLLQTEVDQLPSLIGFDPIQEFLQELETSFEGLLVFTRDPCGGLILYARFKDPALLLPMPFTASNSMAAVPVLVSQAGCVLSIELSPLAILIHLIHFLFPFLSLN